MARELSRITHGAHNIYNWYALCEWNAEVANMIMLAPGA